ncbi:hypothetical protein CRI94_08645 [Longibacter salinarum]|uniref:Secretion system C-terminal sorting domain-containing protein n=1 Tax=Longibacter salinarum TaxID=1850348 RepID=A0A2A8CXK8_9BACT|nr:T9SS type A sorting domain-containing protein [Longibacter salinarum]PEN13386.1 hypothetical protein CRI94_08645 [Longibacter salinarum]
MYVQVFAVVVSSSAFFSNETVPGDYTGSSQPGFNASFDTYSGGPYHTVESQLPVELSAFDVLPNGRNAILSWKTLSETNNDRFVIEHAAPGAGFATVGSVEGQGTTTQQTDYQFTVRDLAPGTHQFRLRQFDMDGASDLSEAISLDIGVNGLAVSRVSPHPIARAASVSISAETASPIKVELFNLLGQRVQTLYTGTVNSGRTKVVDIDADGIPSGTYFIRTTSNMGNDVQRISVVR